MGEGVVNIEHSHSIMDKLNVMDGWKRYGSFMMKYMSIVHVDYSEMLCYEVRAK
jgi:hypothetical protein